MTGPTWPKQQPRPTILCWFSVDPATVFSSSVCGWNNMFLQKIWKILERAILKIAVFFSKPHWIVYTNKWTHCWFDMFHWSSYPGNTHMLQTSSCIRGWSIKIGFIRNTTGKKKCLTYWAHRQFPHWQIQKKCLTYAKNVAIAMLSKNRIQLKNLAIVPKQFAMYRCSNIYRWLGKR